MSKRSKKNRRDKLTKPEAPKQRIRASPIFFLAVAILVTLLFLSWRFRTQYIPATAKPVAEANVASSAAAANNAEYQKLKGRWRRPDGGYILAINSISDAGAMDTAYFNPYPIHVGNAVASRDGDVTKVFVELRDVNYPGSTYTLTYEPSSDQLRGIYYQAVEQQRFEVVFERVK